jgi:hypothetical protein
MATSSSCHFISQNNFLVGVATLFYGHQVGQFHRQKNMLVIIRGAFRLHLPNALSEPPTPMHHQRMKELKVDEECE